jgi:hypothetical protein
VKVTLRLIFGSILGFMIVGTIVASLRQNLFDGGSQMLATPWGWMTLFDAYFGFLTFYVWVAYKETSLLAKVLWFVAIMTLGNMAMALYVLVKLSALRDGAGMRELLVRQDA